MGAEGEEAAGGSLWQQAIATARDKFRLLTQQTLKYSRLWLLVRVRRTWKLGVCYKLKIAISSKSAAHCETGPLTLLHYSAYLLGLSEGDFVRLHLECTVKPFLPPNTTHRRFCAIQPGTEQTCACGIIWNPCVMFRESMSYVYIVSDRTKRGALTIYGAR